MENNINTTKPVGTTSRNTFQTNGEFNYRELLDFIWRLRYYILACVALSMVVAFVVVRSKPQIYQQSTWIKLNKGDDASSTELSLLKELTGAESGSKIDNEIFILKSPSMMCNVVEKLGLDYSYVRYGTPIAGSVSILEKILGYKKYDLYRMSPFELILDRGLQPEDKQNSGSIKIRFRHKTETTCDIVDFIVNGQKLEKFYGVHKYGEKFDLGNVKASINMKNASAMLEGCRYECSWNAPYSVATSMVGNLTADLQRDKRTVGSPDVIILSFKDVSVARARDVLNVLVAVANSEAREYSNIAGMRALDFINGRLEALSNDLGAAETDYQSYRSSTALVDVSSQSNYVLSTDQKNQARLDELGFQFQVLQMIQESIDAQPQGVYSSIPANVGVTDPGLNNIISAYNALALERERMVANSSENNPRVQAINTQLDVQKRGIQTSLSNLKKVYETQQIEVQKNITVGKRQLSNIPRQELQIQQLGRKLNVIEPIYLLLQQKKEETQIAISSQTDNFRVLETAFGSSVPISPKTGQIFLYAFIIGFCLPIVVSWLRMFLRTTVETKADITDRTDVPVLAVITSMDTEKGKLRKLKKKTPAQADESLLITEGRNACTESFGMLRTNLRYLPNAKVIQVTSSIPGEGKSFVSSNLALSIARLNKRVLLIGLDIRKPALGKIFKKDISNAKGTVVSYLIGKTRDLDSLVCPSEAHEKLDVIFAGPAAPNPLELLSTADLGGLIDHFREKYDYIVVDSAPYLPVLDSSIINHFVDATLYVVRADYTSLKLLNEFRDILENPAKPIKNVNIVLNDLDFRASKYQYGYGKGYGYGYGYGYGHRYGYGYGYGRGYGYGYGKGYGYGYGYGYGEEEKSSAKDKTKKA